MNASYFETIIALSLAEDIGRGDITTNSLVPKNHKSNAVIIAKSAGVICGLDIARLTFQALDKNLKFKALVKDGQKIKANTVIAKVSGKTRALLTGERVALNFLSYCSGISTKTREFVDAVKGYKTVILDTRKTTPLLRALERYAVTMGEGANHRFDLSSMAMIKDNHREFASGKMGLKEAVEAVRKNKKPVELEVDTLDELEEGLKTKAHVILLDNMTPIQTKRAVLMRNKLKSNVLLESSGGINLKNVRQYAATGVDRISIGALTHSRQALDISLEFQK
jgi:nicotinate-nucleotide pyrophosphorylase (carboxylating)